VGYGPSIMDQITMNIINYIYNNNNTYDSMCIIYHPMCFKIIMVNRKLAIFNRSYEDMI
jgi:hypothetical protein